MYMKMITTIFTLFTLLLVSSCGQSGGDIVEVVDQNRFADSTEESTSLNIQIEKATAQASFTNTLPIVFDIQFSSDIWPETFTLSDIGQTGTATGLTWTLVNAGDNINYTLTLTAATTEGTVIPSIDSDLVKTGGTLNTASTSTDNTVTFDTIDPIATITSPTGIEWFSSSITVTGTCNEDSDIVILVAPATTTTSCTGGIFSTSLDITAVTDALAINVSATPTDLTGNTGIAVSNSFNKDITPPTDPSALDISANDATCTNSTTTTWTGSTDAASGFSHYEIALGTTIALQDHLAWKDIE